MARQTSQRGAGTVHADRNRRSYRRRHDLLALGVLRDLGVVHRQIPRGCPQVNGKVERSHRTDEDELYRRVIFRTPAELALKLRQWEHEYNHRRLHLALRGRTPAERLCELRIVPEPVQQLA
jgi:transposase InsO family protein